MNNETFKRNKMNKSEIYPEMNNCYNLYGCSTDGTTRKIETKKYTSVFKMMEVCQMLLTYCIYFNQLTEKLWT